TDSDANFLLGALCNGKPASMLRKVLKLLPQSDLVRFVNLRTADSISPLCRAALNDQCDHIDLFLDAGAEIDLPGCEFGSALMAACAAGRLSATKLLVHRKAKFCYVT